MARIELGVAVYRSGLNPNFQIPSSKYLPAGRQVFQYPMTKFKITKLIAQNNSRHCLFGYWELALIWMVVLGIWNFFFSGSSKKGQTR